MSAQLPGQNRVAAFKCQAILSSQVWRWVSEMMGSRRNCDARQKIMDEVTHEKNGFEISKILVT